MGNFQLFPEQASTLAPEVDHLLYFLLAVSVFFTVLIFGAILYFAIRYRRRSNHELPPPVRTGYTLEILWTVIPFGLTMVMFTWGASVFFTASRPPNDALQIYVVGKQWMWKLQHMEGQREINELHVPVGRPVRITMTSEDVIHSFFVPAFRTKQDVVPGRYSTTWFTATKAGKYHLFCAEYCGTNHSGMIGWVYVMEPQDYQTWLSGGSRPKARWPTTARSSSISSPATTATRLIIPAAAPTWSVCLRPAGETGRRRHRQGRRSLYPRIHSAAAGQSRGRL